MKLRMSEQCRSNETIRLGKLVLLLLYEPIKAVFYGQRWNEAMRARFWKVFCVDSNQYFHTNRGAELVVWIVSSQGVVI